MLGMCSGGLSDGLSSASSTGPTHLDERLGRGASSNYLGSDHGSIGSGGDILGVDLGRVSQNSLSLGLGLRGDGGGEVDLGLGGCLGGDGSLSGTEEFVDDRDGHSGQREMG